MDWAGAAEAGEALEAVYLLGAVAGVPVFPPDPRAWGYGWGTLFSARHTEAVGGVDALGAVPGADVRTGPDGQVWVRLGADPAGVSPEQIAALRTVLAPVLPTGFRLLEDYFHPEPDPYADPPLPYLL